MRGVGHQRLVAVLAMCATIVVAQLDVNINLGNDPRFNKMLPTVAEVNNKTDAAAATTVATPKTSTAPTAAAKVVKLHDIEHSAIGKHSHVDEVDEYGDTYDYNDYYEDEVDAKSTKPTKRPQQVIVKKEHVDKWKLKPIKGNDQNTLEDEKHTTAKSKPKVSDTLNLLDDTIDGDDDDDGADDDDDDDDEYDYDEDINTFVDETTPTTSTTVRPRSGYKTSVTKAATTRAPHTSTTSSSGGGAYTDCPANCVCQLNFNGFRVASCDRLDAETMHFDESITDLEVLNVPPKYPLLFGANFFKRIGLQHVNSIKIVDATIENVHPDAFSGLDQLYSVNLTNTGLDMLPPDAFAHSTKLRILSLAGNDLHAMQQKSSPFVDYMLNAPSVEELYLTRCNIKHLLPTAFGRLTNIVFIGLAENMLVTLPHDIFHKLAALEEVDLSSNTIENLPRHIFDNTSLSILNLRYNEMSGRPAFIAPRLQKIDLSYNKLVQINDMMFTDMPNVDNLVLKGNAIRKVHHAAFAPLKDLRHIDLSFNDLEQVSELMFLENTQLDTIRLNDNARLRKLPMEGFNSQVKHFKVYLFDVSNCDLSELGENTFATMPGLTTLNLSWNNIESLGAGLFSYLGRLVKLDLSNNLLGELGDMLLLHNRYLRKLNLAGNPLEKLSSKIFLPTKQLNELDLSDCNLRSIWTDADKASQSKNLLKNLKSLNVSNNEIVHARISDVAYLERLAVLDVSNNKLSCDKDFRDLMQWLETKKIASGHLRAFLRESGDATETADLAGLSPWAEYSQTRCKKFDAAAAAKTAKPLVSTNNETDNDDGGETEEDDDDVDDDDDDIVDSIHDKANEPATNGDNVYDDDDGPDAGAEVADENNNNNNTDDGDNDDDDGPNGEDEIKLTAEVTDLGFKATEVKVNSVVDSAEKPAKKKTTPATDNDDEYSDEDSEDDEDGDEDDDDEAEDDDDDDNTNDDDHFDTLRATYLQYGYVLPMLLVVLSVFVILMAIAKIVSVMMHRRGERYRQALLASKNSIVYQKLSEEIGAPATPKFHRYAPIQQV